MSWRRYFRRKQRGDDLTQEIEAYLAHETDQNVAAGMDRDRARWAALRKLGSPTRIKETVYEMNQFGRLETLWQDLRYGARLLRLSPGFAAVAILSLAMGIGANTAIFQLLDALRMRMLPVHAPEELAAVRLAADEKIRGSRINEYLPLTNAVWERIRERQQVLSGVFAWAPETFNLAAGGQNRYARGIWVSGDFFGVLGVPPALGRILTAADDQRGCGSPGVVLSYSFWQREYGGAPSAVGSKITLEGRPFEIVGVTPAGFYGLEIGRSYDVALPLCAEALLRRQSFLDRGTVWWLIVMGRLKPGMSTAQATAQLEGISKGIFEATLPAGYPPESVKDYLSLKLAAYPAERGVSGLRAVYSSPLSLLLAIAGAVLLIACANLANLLLARAMAREREIAIRLAIGASRARVVRQLLAESLLLAAAGAILGAFLARLLSGFFISFLSRERSPLFIDLGTDWRVLAFTTALAMLTCVLFGLTPAMRATRTDPIAAMRAGGRGLTGSRQRFRVERILVVAQIALSVALLAGALLFSQSLRNLMHVDTGFQDEGVLVLSADLRLLKLPNERRNQFRGEIVERLRAIPGVDSAAEAAFLPLSGTSTTNRVWMDGSSFGHAAPVRFNWGGPGFIRTLGIPLLAGRDFEPKDQPNSPGVALVNEAFAAKLGLGPNPVGRRFHREATPGDKERIFEIIGLVKNTKYFDLREDFLPVAFLAAGQQPGNELNTLVLRSRMPEIRLVAEVKRALVELSPQIGFDFRMFHTEIQDGLSRERLLASVSGFFGLIATLLATIGLYGLMSYMVVRRRNEIGIRMALGADRGKLLKKILSEAGILVAVGLAVGGALAIAAATMVRSILFGLEPHDPASIGAAAAALAAAALAASYLPAMRAARLDPMVALREE